jgi:hypothetical protein
MSNLLVQNIKHTNNTTAMSVDSSGRIVTPARPSFLVRGYGSVTGGSQSINNITTHSSVGLYYNFDEVSHNLGSHFTNSTGKFVVPVTGLYFISAGYGYKVAANWGNIVLFAQDGDSSTSGFLAQWTPNSIDAIGSTISIHKQCTVGDEIAVGSSTGYTFPNSAIEYFFFTVTLIG